MAMLNNQMVYRFVRFSPLPFDQGLISRCLSLPSEVRSSHGSRLEGQARTSRKRGTFGGQLLVANLTKALKLQCSNENM